MDEVHRSMSLFQFEKNLKNIHCTHTKKKIENIEICSTFHYQKSNLIKLLAGESKKKMDKL